MTALDCSIIVPTFNRPEELGRCVRFLAALDYPHDRFEAIIVDDGGESSAASATASYSGQLRMRIIRRERGGPAAARNAGARIAGGNVLAFTDDDCAPEPDWLSVLMTSLRAQPDVLAGGRVVNSLADNPYSAASQLIFDLVYAYYNQDAGRPRFFASNNMAVSADLFRRIGGFDGRFRTSEDRDFCDRWISSNRRLLYVRDAVVRHSHRLTLRTFWRQHVGYGRGAYRFHRAHCIRSASQSAFEGGFYTATLRRLPRLLVGRRKQPLLAALMIVWQVANLAGFAAEWWRSQAGRGEHA